MTYWNKVQMICNGCFVASSVDSLKLLVYCVNLFIYVSVMAGNLKKWVAKLACEIKSKK